MNKLPLITVIVLSYKNYIYIYEALDSILTQDYGNIELIVSNDCSDDFDVDAIRAYIDLNKKSNITNVIINKNEVNMGTVKHCNKLIKVASGQYIKLIAADDAFYSDTIISVFVNYFISTESYVVASKAAVYDKDLNNYLSILPEDESLQSLLNLEPKKFYREMAKGCKIPAPAVCFNRKYFEEYGYFSEKYFIVEDWPTWLSMLRNGIKIDFIDFISVKYRSEIGTSNQGIIDAKKSPIFEKDYYKIIENEILPYKKLLGTVLWRKLKYLYVTEHKWDKLSSVGRILFYLAYVDIFIGKKIVGR